MLKEIIILLITLNSFSQEIQPSTPIYIYQYTEGIKEFVPIQVIEDNKVYKIEEGVKDFVPTYKIERQQNEFEFKED